MSEDTVSDDTVTVITDESSHVAGRTCDGRVEVADSALADAIGWSLRPEGLCRGEVCVPVADTSALDGDGWVDLARVAAAIGAPAVIDTARSIAAFGLPADQRSAPRAGEPAAAFRLPDVSGVPVSLDDFAGRKKLVVTFATWCGCREDLPGWQALADGLADEGRDLAVIGVALDEDAAEVALFADQVDFPVLVDRAHVVSERYAVSNVPTVVWIDEDDRVARPNVTAFGTDTWTAVHGVASGPHLDAVRDWVRTGTVPESDGGADVTGLDDDEVMARLEFRVATELRRRGDDAGAAAHFDRARELAPVDFTVARAQMPLRGDDPFGAEFMELYDRWQAAGAPVHALPPDRSLDV